MNDVITKIDGCLVNLSKALNPPHNGIVAKQLADNTRQLVMEFAENIKEHNSDLYNCIVALNGELFIQRLYSFDPQTQRLPIIVNRIAFGGLTTIVNLCKLGMMPSNTKAKPTKIFISHTEDDTEYVEAFVTLLEKIGIQPEHLFVYSVAGYGIKEDNEDDLDIPEALREQFENYNLFVIMMLSENYYRSADSLNEMGATWILNYKYQAVLLPGFNFSQIRGLINPRKIGIKLDDNEEKLSNALADLKDKIVSLLGLTAPKEEIWNRHRTEFMNAVNAIIKKQKRADAAQKVLSTAASVIGV